MIVRPAVNEKSTTLIRGRLDADIVRSLFLKIGTSVDTSNRITHFIQEVLYDQGAAGYRPQIESTLARGQMGGQACIHAFFSLCFKRIYKLVNMSIPIWSMLPHQS